MSSSPGKRSLIPGNIGAADVADIEQVFKTEGDLLEH